MIFISGMGKRHSQTPFFVDDLRGDTADVEGDFMVLRIMAGKNCVELRETDLYGFPVEICGQVANVEQFAFFLKRRCDG